MQRTWILGILCVFICCFLVGYTIQTQKIAALNGARNHSVTNVHYLSMDVERTLYGLYQTFTGIENFLSAISHSNNSILEQDIQTALDRLVADNPFVTSLLVLDAKGNPINRDSNNNQENLYLTDYFSVHKAHQVKNLYIGRPVASKKRNGQWTFGVSKAFRAADDSLQSVMVATIDIDYMQNRFLGAQLPPETTMTLSSLDGYTYIRLPEHEQFIGKFKKNLVRPADTANKTIIFRQSAATGGDVNIVTSRRIGIYPLIVSISEPETAILATWHQYARNSIAFGAFISVIIFFMTYRIALFQKRQFEIKEELKNQASTDSLTGLANRRYILEQAEHEIKKARRTRASLSFVLIDLDHFKVVNDSYGHDMGDKVLIKTAKILKKMCREADIVSRYGGEEFLLLLPNTDIDGAIADAERIRKTLAETYYRHNQKTFCVTGSFGVSQWAEHEEDYNEAMRRADKALYKVKNLGRNDVDYQLTATLTPLRTSRKYKQTTT